MKPDWTANDIPDFSGKIAIVTGANIGLGLEITKRLAEHGATVILGCRNTTKAEAARKSLLDSCASLSEAADRLIVHELDVSSQASVKSFASTILSTYPRLDILMCNAGVMAMQERHESVDGIEMQLATNHIGHFVLAGDLLPLLSKRDDNDEHGARIVMQSSSANWNGSFNFDDLNAQKSYSPWDQYSMTKLAAIAFATEFNARVKSNKVKAFAAHPGLVIGQLQANQAGDNSLYKMMYRTLGSFAGTYETGALPALYACTSPHATIGDFYGPNGFYRGIFRGKHPKAVYANKIGTDATQARKFWDACEQIAKYKYNFDDIAQ